MANISISEFTNFDFILQIKDFHLISFVIANYSQPSKPTYEEME